MSKGFEIQLPAAASTDKSKVLWNDVAGLEDVKGVLRKTVLLPVNFPQLFPGQMKSSERNSTPWWQMKSSERNSTPWWQRKPCGGIMLYGFPGTGKTMLARGLGTQANDSTFFTVSSSDFMSKWLNESEKSIKNLFVSARERKPSIIYIDDFDTLCGSRSENETETGRRIKAEFLEQMQGVGNENDGVQVLAVTNVPWTIDSAIMKRFQKKISVPLPEAPTRVHIFKTQLGITRHSLTEADFKEIGVRTDGYTGSDIVILAREVMMTQVRGFMQATHFKKATGPSRTDPGVIEHDLLTPCLPGDAGAIELSYTAFDHNKLLEPPLEMSVVLKTLSTSKSSVSVNDLMKLKKFTKDLAQEG